MKRHMSAPVVGYLLVKHGLSIRTGRTAYLSSMLRHGRSPVKTWNGKACPLPAAHIKERDQCGGHNPWKGRASSGRRSSPFHARSVPSSFLSCPFLVDGYRKHMEKDVPSTGKGGQEREEFRRPRASSYVRSTVKNSSLFHFSITPHVSSLHILGVMEKISWEGEFTLRSDP